MNHAINDALANGSLSFRFKRALAELSNADPVDAVLETALLAQLMQKRLDEINAQTSI